VQSLFLGFNGYKPWNLLFRTSPFHLCSFTTISPASFHQLSCMITTHAIDSVHCVSMLPTQTTTDSVLFSFSPANENIISHPNQEIQTLLQKYHAVFSKPQSPPPQRPHDHHIYLQTSANPVNIKPYRYPHYQKEDMTTLITEMLKDGIIQPSTSPYSSPVLLVKKKDGTWRFCVNYRALNTITIKNRFPVPTIDELLDELHGAHYFTKINLRFGYHQIRLAPNDIHKSGFRTLDGHYEFLVMPFGLTNVPSTFQAAMNDLLRPYLRKCALVFFFMISSSIAHLGTPI